MSNKPGSRAPLALDAVLDPAARPESAGALEDLGYHGGWVTETIRDPFLYLTSAADATAGMRLGTGVAIAFARSPMTMALCAHDLQRRSGGRFELGLGSQVRAHITRRFSMPWSRPVDRMREYVGALRAIWASWNDAEPLAFTGDFYTHTLMTDFFNPGPTGYPAPPVLLAGVGTRMTALAGEIADGFICGPLTSALSFREHTVPALEAGRAKAKPSGRPFEVCTMPLVVTGADARARAAAAEATRARIAFYASTPAYREILEIHGWGELHERLHRLSRERNWEGMTALVTDEVLEAFAVVAEPDAVATAIAERYSGYADRAILQAVTDPGPEVWRAVLAAGARPEVLR